MFNDILVMNDYVHLIEQDQEPTEDEELELNLKKEKIAKTHYFKPILAYLMNEYGITADTIEEDTGLDAYYITQMLGKYDDKKELLAMDTLFQYFFLKTNWYECTENIGEIRQLIVDQSEKHTAFLTRLYKTVQNIGV